MSLTVDVLDPRHDPKPGMWEELRVRCGQHALWAWDPLRAGALDAADKMLVAVVRDGAEPAAVVCATLTGLTGLSPRRAGVLDIYAPMAVSHQGWWFVGDPPWQTRREMLRTYVRAMRRELGLGCRAVLWRQVTEEDRAAVPGRIRLTREQIPIARIATPWPDLAGWYAGLPPGRRQNLRRRRRQFDAELHVGTGPAGDLVTAAEITALKQENDRKYKQGAATPQHQRLRVPPITAPYFEALIGRDDVFVIAYRDGDTLVAVQLLLDHPTWPIQHYWGALPPERGGRKHLYFDMYGRAVEWAVTTGKKGLVWGKTMSGIKHELGAELVRNAAVVTPHL
jgi:hypothetical protein